MFMQNDEADDTKVRCFMLTNQTLDYNINLKDQIDKLGVEEINKKYTEAESETANQEINMFNE